MIETYRTLYRTFITEAVKAGIARDADDFNARALVHVDDEVRAAARNGDEDAVVVLCDTAEIWLDDALELERDAAPAVEDEDEAPGYPEWDEGEAYRRALWLRSCDAQLDYRD